MAHENAKRSAKKNAFRLRLFISISVGISLLPAAISIISSSYNLLSTYPNRVHNDTSGENRSFHQQHGFSYTWFLFKLLFWGLHYVVTILILKQLGRPSRSGSGEVIACVDLSAPDQLGMYSYAQDVLWLCWVAHFMSSIIHSIFIILYLPIPVFAAYKVIGSVIMPLINARADAMVSSTEQDEKRRHSGAQRKNLHRRY